MSQRVDDPISGSVAATTARAARVFHVELTEVVRRRRMVRLFDTSKDVSHELVENMLNLAIRAPSAGHTQGRRFLVLDDITSRTLFWAATSSVAPSVWRDRMMTAPVLVVCFSDQPAYLDRYAQPDKVTSQLASGPDGEWPIPFWYVDMGMAVMTLLLAAGDQNLGACFFAVPALRWASLAEAFAVPSGLTPVGVVALGHPAEGHGSASSVRSRKTLDEVVSYRSFDRSPAD